ncbi:pentalenene synthase [Streptomyces fodineus]|uniref:Pentalenene synthase n=1 Tax=Streptomyces fodineus TaxID=1904616 RepID=A0A1D7YP30_9ACTN|nr:pentalenene synthase [Streptomyces fodineus]
MRHVDHIPASQRRAWAAAGHYPDRDLYSQFRSRVDRDPAAPAVIDADGTFGYGELDDLTRRLAAGLARLGIGEGEVVAVQLPNGRLACAVELAVAALGAIALPFPVGRGEREAENLLRRSEAVAVITVAEHHGHPCAARVREHSATLPGLRAVIAVGAEVQGCVPIDALLASDAREFVHHAADPDAPARILVTSGSEAEPKMVLYSHNALSGGRGAQMAALHEDPGAMRNFFLMPLGSAFGSSGTPVTLAAFGATLVVRPAFDPAGTLAMVEAARVTHLFGVPTMLRMLLDCPAIHDTDLSSLRAVVIGGAALDPDTARRAGEILKCAVVPIYGSADGVGCHNGLTGFDGTIGRPNPAVADIRVVDENGIPVPPGTTGELVSRGPMSPMCYFNSPELDRRLRTPDGWTRTGDLGVFDEQGRLTLVGRCKDVVIRGGLNISPAEVESVLITHPDIRDVACVPVPDPHYGERMCACVATSAELTLTELTRHLASCGMEPRKFPERLLVLPALPLGPAGKVDRRALRVQAAASLAGDGLRPPRDLTA